MPLSKSDDEGYEFLRFEDDFVGDDVVISNSINLLGQSCQQLESRRLFALVQLVDVDDPRSSIEHIAEGRERVGLRLCIALGSS